MCSASYCMLPDQQPGPCWITSASLCNPFGVNVHYLHVFSLAQIFSSKHRASVLIWFIYETAALSTRGPSCTTDAFHAAHLLWTHNVSTALRQQDSSSRTTTTKNDGKMFPNEKKVFLAATTTVDSNANVETLSIKWRDAGNLFSALAREFSSQTRKVQRTKKGIIKSRRALRYPIHSSNSSTWVSNLSSLFLPLSNTMQSANNVS